jgi:DNA helicase-2/ATP-dependent DNA helicase PcrA
VRELEDEHAEARFVVGEIERLVDEGVSRAEIAVFYRTNAQSRVLEDTLVRAEIPYQVIGGTKFYERAEIKDAIAYLSLLANPADVVSFTRVANSPRRGIGQTSLSRVIAHAAWRPSGPSRRRDGSRTSRSWSASRASSTSGPSVPRGGGGGPRGP